MRRARGFILTRLRLVRRLSAPAAALLCASVLGCRAAPGDAIEAPSGEPELHISVAGGLELAEPLSLRPGEAAQLQVEVLFPDGRRTDVTSARTTVFLPTDKRRLVASDSGRVEARAAAGPDEGSSLTFLIVGVVVEGTVAPLSETIAFRVESERGSSGLASGAGELRIRAGKTVLRVGESTQLVVEEVLEGDGVRDVTLDGTSYTTNSEQELVPELDGRVTCIGTRGERRGDGAIIARRGTARAVLDFELRPGGGPSLRVEPEKKVLAPGESVDLRVISGAEDLSAASGTTYVTLTGYGRHEMDVVSIDGEGRLTAAPSLGRYNWRSVWIFVRNGERVGWTEVEVRPAG